MACCWDCLANELDAPPARAHRLEAHGLGSASAGTERLQKVCAGGRFALAAG